MDIQQTFPFQFYLGWQQIHHIYTQTLEQGFTPQEAWALEYCSDGNISPEGLADFLHLNPESASLFIDQLKQKNWITQEQDEHLTLSHEGKQQLDQLREKYPQLIQTIDHQLTEEDAQFLKQVNQKMKQNNILGW